MKCIYSIGVDFASHGQGTTAYYAARALYRAGVLKKVICMSHKKSEIPNNLIQDVFLGGVYAEKAIIALAKLFGSVNGYGLKDTIYDYLASKHIENCEIFHGWALQSVSSLKKAKEKRAKITLLERPSSHILYQRDMLEQEYLLQNQKKEIIEDIELERNLKGYELADFVIVASSFACETFKKYNFNARKLITIPYGYDNRLFMPRPKPKDKFRLMYSGLISFAKGVHYLLDAWNKLRLRNAELILVGKVLPDFQKKLNEYTSKMTDIFIKNFVPYADMPNEYNNANLFVFPSINDGFGLVVTEAMGCGLPVIVTENTGAKDCIRDGIEGFTVAIRDGNALAQKILYFYEDRVKTEQMGKQASDRAKEFTWDKYGQRLVSCYERLLETKGAAE